MQQNYPTTVIVTIWGITVDLCRWQGGSPSYKRCYVPQVLVATCIYMYVFLIIDVSYVSLTIKISVVFILLETDILLISRTKLHILGDSNQWPQ